MLTISEIKNLVQPVAVKYQLAKLELFGSYANQRATEKSDIDFLVKFKTDTPSIFDVAGLQFELQNKLKRAVDVITIPLVNKKLKIENAVLVYAG